jgi:hypothetical protein
MRWRAEKRLSGPAFIALLGLLGPPQFSSSSRTWAPAAANSSTRTLAPHPRPAQQPAQREAHPLVPPQLASTTARSELGDVQRRASAHTTWGATTALWAPAGGGSRSRQGQLPPKPLPAGLTGGGSLRAPRPPVVCQSQWWVQTAPPAPDLPAGPPEVAHGGGQGVCGDAQHPVRAAGRPVGAGADRRSELGQQEAPRCSCRRPARQPATHADATAAMPATLPAAGMR